MERRQTLTRVIARTLMAALRRKNPGRSRGGLRPVRLTRLTRLTRPLRDTCLALAMLLLAWASHPDELKAQQRSVPRRLPAISTAGVRFVDSLLATLSLADRLGQLTQVGGQGTPTGPAVRTGGEQEIRLGRVGSFLGVVGAIYTRQLQKVAVEESLHHIPLLFSFDVIHGFRTILPVPLADA